MRKEYGMNIKCPNCGASIALEQNVYDSIANEIRNEQFEQELEKRVVALSKEKEAEIKLAVSKAENVKEKEISDLKEKLATANSTVDSVKEKSQSELKIVLAQKENEIATLKGQLDSSKKDSDIAVKSAVQEKEKQIIQLQSDYKLLEERTKNNESAIKEQYNAQLKAKDDEIAFYKDFKAKESTKQIGEDLEQYCLSEFNKVRAMGFPNAYFEKDNKVSSASGSKGDLIFRDYTEDKIEYISIMFECKNQADLTATKKTNESFFQELDKDRNEKGCEYAVLVSMLEENNDTYNVGIVDVSHKYPKMYVIRPQFLIPVITFLRNAAMNTIETKRELEAIQAQNIDITHFEDDLNKFKEGFSKNYNLASKKFMSAIDEIDKAIDHLQKIRDALRGSENYYRLANNKLEDLSVKKLTKNNPTMKQKFDNLNNQK